MISKKIAVTVFVISAVVVISAVSLYTKAYSGKINVVDYKEAEEVNESSYQINKYEDVNAVQWIDENNVLVIKNIPQQYDYDSVVPMKLMSIYNLNTKTYKDYNDVILTYYDVKGVSLDGKYLLYREPRKLPEPESEEWNNQIKSQELFHAKMNIIDLSTGDIIKDFDKTVNNTSAEYLWISGNYIFVNYGGEWAVLDAYGKSLKRGTFNFDNCYDDYATIIGVDDINDSGDDVCGEFYYTKEFMGTDGNIGIRIYSMDVDSKKEEFIYKSEDSIEACKMGKNIVIDYFNNNGEANEDGIYENRTFGIKVINKNGELLQNTELPKDSIDSMMQLSPTGENISFEEVTDHLNFRNRSTLEDNIQVFNVSNGNLKVLGKIEDFMDKDKQEEFYNNKMLGEDGNEIINKMPGPAFGSMQWDESGNSLFYTYKYTSKEDGENHTDTYVVTFDN